MAELIERSGRANRQTNTGPRAPSTGGIVNNSGDGQGKSSNVVFDMPSQSANYFEVKRWAQDPATRLRVAIAVDTMREGAM
jgi:hypothetical protein